MALKKFSFALLACLMSCAVSAVAADQIGIQLRALIEKARPELGDLPAWQEEIFLSEILASPGRFVRDYRTAGDKVVKADVDFEGIRRYLAFNATQILKPEANKVLLFVRSNAACTDCAKALGNIRADLKGRLEHRGLVVLVASADELKRDPSDAFAKRNANGWILAEVRSEEDPDHIGDNRYALFLDFRFPGTIASGTQKRMEILPSDSIEISMSRLAIDGFSELGRKAKASFAASNTEGTGIELAIEGVSNFSMLTQVKTKLQAILGTEYRVVEKRIERGGRASLAVLSTAAGEKNGAAIAEDLKKMPFEGFTLKILNIGTGQVDLRLTASGGTHS